MLKGDIQQLGGTTFTDDDDENDNDDYVEEEKEEEKVGECKVFFYVLDRHDY